MINALNAANGVKFGAVIAQKTTNPDVVRLLLTEGDRGKIHNLPKDDATDELVLTRQDGKLTIEKEEYDPGTTLTSLKAEPVSHDELGFILDFAHRAVDAPTAKGAVQDSVKPLLRRTANGANIATVEAYQRAVKANESYEAERAMLDLFTPFMDWLKQR